MSDRKRKAKSDKERKKGRKLLEEVNGSSDSTVPKIIKTGRIIVEGYDTGLPSDDVNSTLRKLLASCGCGEITDVFIRQIDVNLISTDAIIYFAREESVEKALQLNGKDVGGWIAKVKAYPVSELASQFPVLMVQGYDTSLTNKVIKKALRKHFSSCGKVTEVGILKSSGVAVVYISGEEAAEKALERSVFDIEGRKVVAKLISTPINPTFHRPRFSRRGRPEPLGKKA